MFLAVKDHVELNNINLFVIANRVITQRMESNALTSTSAPSQVLVTQLLFARTNQGLTSANVLKVILVILSSLDANPEGNVSQISTVHLRLPVKKDDVLTLVLDVVVVEPPVR
jgi:hypothetical protein